MSDMQNIMERFRGAIKSIEERIEAAEARPEQAEIQELRDARAKDLAAFEVLRAQIEPHLTSKDQEET